MMNQKKPLSVFSVKMSGNGALWTKAGVAYVNADGSLNVYLDVLPLDGRLHIRATDEVPLKPQPDGPAKPQSEVKRYPSRAAARPKRGAR